FNYTSSGNKFIDTVNVRKTFAVLSKAKIDQFMLSWGSMLPFGVSKQETFSAYATDVVSFTDRLSAMLSLRVDRYSYKGVSNTDGYNQTSLAPKLGLVYQVIKNGLSVFGNYMSGFQNNAPLTQPDGTTLVLKPMYANQYEAGIKAEALGNKLAVTASYYNITIDNATRVAANGFSVQDGKQVSKGAELEVTGNPLPGLNIVAGYAYNDNRIIRTTDHNIEGNKAANAPESVVNAWVGYRFQETMFKNIGLGFGGNYVGKNYMTTANTYFIPAYTVLNGTLFYDADKWRLGLKVNNIAGKKYWDLYGAPQALRNIAVSLVVKF
ncbi:MAG: TonB-dependent receptor, partial [Bacteroidetes bacterium]|nr:TonB-dependent receptor [Bacteroidota bacterium]